MLSTHAGGICHSDRRRVGLDRRCRRSPPRLLSLRLCRARAARAMARARRPPDTRCFHRHGHHASGGSGNRRGAGAIVRAEAQGYAISWEQRARRADLEAER